ncbi:MAG TPA: sulfotransferase [Rudaea sp.]|jgi:sulfotransferase
MTTRFVGVAGLPRSGSTLLCQLLGEHPQIHSEGHSSPLCSALLRLRHGISDDDFFLSQLDVDFDRGYAHLKSAMRGFVHGWYHDCTKVLVADKNRGWLRNFEYLLAVESAAKLVVCVRELGQVYGSIEAQHQRTILIDFPDHTANHDRYNRADVLFAKDGVIGNPLRALEAVQDLPIAIQQRIHLVTFERLMRDPLEAMADVYKFIGADAHRFDPKNLRVRPHESDSHYRHKYPHKQYASIEAPMPHAIPNRIQSEIEKTYAWYYDHFYPDWQRLTPSPR